MKSDFIERRLEEFRKEREKLLAERDHMREALLRCLAGAQAVVIVGFEHAPEAIHYIRECAGFGLGMRGALE